MLGIVRKIGLLDSWTPGYRAAVTRTRKNSRLPPGTEGGGEIDTADDNQRRQVMGSSSGAILNWRTGESARTSEQLPRRDRAYRPGSQTQKDLRSDNDQWRFQRDGAIDGRKNGWGDWSNLMDNW